MKSIRQKAKAYDNAIKIAKSKLHYTDKPCFVNVTELFPELAENEDERVREDILAFVKREGQHIDKYKWHKWIAWLEKQYEQKSAYKEHTFKSIPRLLEMIEPTDRAKSYCKKLIDSLQTEGYSIDAKIVGECLRQMNGENVPMAVMDIKGQCEQKETNLVEILKHYPKETELYSPLYGRLWLAEVDEKNEIITCYKHRLEEGCTRAVLEQEDTVSFYSNGTTGLPDFNISKDCMLFLYDFTKQGEQKVSVVEFNAKDWYVSKVDGKIYNATFMENPSANLSRKLEIEKAAMSATGIIEQEKWFIKGAEWSDKNPSYISSEKQDEQKPTTIDIDKMVVDYANNKERGNEEFGKPVNCMIRAYRQGLKDAIGKVVLKPWSEEDERIHQCLIRDQEEALDDVRNDKYGHSEIISDLKEMYHERIDWLKSLKERIGG